MTTTFLERTGMDLAIASVIAPLASYGMHRIIPAPDFSFIAIANTLNICVRIALQDLTSKYLDQAEGKNVFENSKTCDVLKQLSYILQTSTSYLLPIFARYIGQRAGIQVPDYLPLIGYNSLANGAFWITQHCIEIYEIYYPKPTK